MLGPQDCANIGFYFQSYIREQCLSPERRLFTGDSRVRHHRFIDGAPNRVAPVFFLCSSTVLNCFPAHGAPYANKLGCIATTNLPLPGVGGQAACLSTGEQNITQSFNSRKHCFHLFSAVKRLCFKRAGQSSTIIHPSHRSHPSFLLKHKSNLNHPPILHRHTIFRMNPAPPRA